MNELNCAIKSIESLGADVYEVCLQLPAASQIAYRPGQYLLMAPVVGEFSAFSIASAPAEQDLIRVQILATNTQPKTLLAQLRQKQIARVQLPLGDICVDLSDPQALLLIAAGTGVAQMHSIIEQARHQGSQVPIHLYWGAREKQDFYSLPAWEKWQAMGNVKLHKVVSHDADWAGRCGLLHEAIVSDMASLSGYRVIASGSPAMVYGTLDALVAHGMRPEQMQADVFSYAPRPTAGA